MWICGQSKTSLLSVGKTKIYVCPYIVGPLVSSNQWPIFGGGWVGGLWMHFFFSGFFCLRVTACSLYIHKTIIFTLFSLYLEVNGCQETNEAARNSCTSTRRLPCDAEGGIKQQTSALLTGRGEKCFCFDKPTQTNTHRHALELAVTSTAHNPRLIFAFSPVSLRQLVSHVSH